MAKQIFTILAARENTVYELGIAYSQGIAYDFESSVKHLYKSTRVIKGKAKAIDYCFMRGFILKNSSN